MKIVINQCFGGFGLSDEASKMYLELVTNDPQSKWFGWTIIESKNLWNTIEWKLLCGLNEKNFYSRDISRTDPHLIKVVEVLKEKANDCYSELCIEDIPSGTLYRINEYDGNESIEYKENDSWLVAT